MTYPSMPLRVPPFAHQTAAYNAALELFDSGASRGYGLLFEMGCCKTSTAIGIGARLYLDGKAARALVVAPLSILGVWREEFETFCGADYTLAILSGSGAKKADTLRHLGGSALQVAVVNYESAKILEAEIAKWNPNIIIADEAHRIKTHSSQTAKCLGRLGAKARYRLFLTGTLITNKAEDVWSVYRFAEPRVFGRGGYFSWRNEYFDSYGYGGHQYRLKQSKEAEFAEKVRSISYRVTKQECLDLPATTDVVRGVELEASAMKLYRALAKDCIAELGGAEISVTNILTKLLRLSQLTGGHLTDDEGNTNKVSTAKMDALTDIVDEALNDNRKIVIIARFTPEVEAICQMLEKQGVKYSRVDGGVKDRAEQVERFQNDAEVMAFVGQIQVAGVGLTLTASSLMVFYSLDYSTANHEQAWARIHRAGQKQPCTYYYLQAKNTLDAKVLAALRDKADFAKRMVDDLRNGINALE